MNETIWKIYKTTCLVNGKVYIGQTIKYGSALRRYLGSGILINSAIKKHGRNNFVKEILHTLYYSELANEYEALYIEIYSSTDKKLGYNILYGAGKGIAVGIENPRYGTKDSEETCRKKSISLKGKNLGRKATEETKKRMSECRSGEKNYFYGKKHSTETKLKISNLRTGLKLSESHKRSISKSITGGKNPIAKAVEAYNPSTGDVIVKFDCISDAVKVYGGHIDESASGKRKRAAKMYWRYSL